MRVKINSIIEEMEMVYKNDARPWIIGYSGGKDSTLVVQLVFQMLLGLPKADRNKEIYVVSSNTLVENPIILEYLKESHKLIAENARKNNLPLRTVIVRPDSTIHFGLTLLEGFSNTKIK